jgi:aryl-alcohol dehydrogenase-like predicted oxidoreductase
MSDPKLSHRVLGETDLMVSPLCLGLGNWGSNLTGEEAVRLLDAFLSAGGNFVDTAHCYGFWGSGGTGASERELGAAMAELRCREWLVIATKGGHPACEGGYPRSGAYLSPEVLASDVSESLARLRTDWIDLYLLHRDDRRVPVGEIIEALNSHVTAGRLRHLGASNWSVERLAEANDYAAAHGLRGFCVSQVHFSLADPKWPVSDDPTMRTMTPEMMAWHTRTALPIMAYSSSAGGFFAGRESAEAGYGTPENVARRERARALAEQLGATPAQIALRYLIAQPFQTIPIVGTLHAGHLFEAVASTRLDLTAEQVRWLRDG